MHADPDRAAASTRTRRAWLTNHLLADTPPPPGTATFIATTLLTDPGLLTESLAAATLATAFLDAADIAHTPVNDTDALRALLAHVVASLEVTSTPDLIGWTTCLSETTHTYLKFLSALPGYPMPQPERALLGAASHLAAPPTARPPLDVRSSSRDRTSRQRAYGADARLRRARP